MKLLKVRYKNFFSVGNSFIEIDLTRNERTLVIGENGAGKSTFVSAICFGLYGKPFKEVNKPTIVNSINKKNMVVEIEMESGGKSYLVRRGIKPNIFDVIEDGKAWNQSGRADDHQDLFEKNVLGMNFVTFKQRVVIGSGGYTPFMKLKTPERRSVVENILTLQKFSKMNVLLKTYLDKIKSDLEENDNATFQNGVNLKSSTDKLRFLKSNRDRVNENNQKEITKLEEKIEVLDARLATIETEIAKIPDIEKEYSTSNLEFKKINSALDMVQNNIASWEVTIAEIQEEDVCPTCSQKIDETIKSNKIQELETKKTKFESNLPLLEKKLEKAKLAFSNVEKTLNAQKEFLTEKRNLLFEKNSHLDAISNLSEVSFDNNDLVLEANNYKQLSKEKDTLFEKRNALIDEKEIYTLSATLLKDNGIKANIISKYIPHINKAINDNLDVMNFYAEFEIDENFNEIIRSRHRDTFTYENFSEGEKARIDLALLFAWRSVTKARTNIDCNILVLDEVFDGSLDGNGTEILLNILESLGDANIFVISHKTDVMLEKFENVIHFEKKNNFTQIKEETKN